MGMYWKLKKKSWNDFHVRYYSNFKTFMRKECTKNYLQIECKIITSDTTDLVTVYVKDEIFRRYIYDWGEDFLCIFKAINYLIRQNYLSQAVWFVKEYAIWYKYHRRNWAIKPGGQNNSAT